MERFESEKIVPFFGGALTLVKSDSSGEKDKKYQSTKKWDDFFNLKTYQNESLRARTELLPSRFKIPEHAEKVFEDFWYVIELLDARKYQSVFTFWQIFM